MAANVIGEYVEINGIQQYFLHFPAESDSVVLFLHGGPGNSELIFAHTTRPANPACNFVYYDQRGTGKTQQKSKSEPEDVIKETLLDDLQETIQYVKKKYSTEKIILVGHSWGSVLGTEYVKKHPQDVLCYVGMGQVVDMLKGEHTAYKHLGELIKEKGDPKDIKAYEAFNGFPYDLTEETFLPMLMKFRKLEGRYDLTTNVSKTLKLAFSSPVFSWADILILTRFKNVNKGLVDSLLSYSTTDFLNYELPVFYICGRNDWQVPSIVAEEYFNKIHAPRKKLYWIANAGHLTDLDNPVDYNKVIEEIVKSF